MLQLILVLSCSAAVDVEIHRRDGQVESGTVTALSSAQIDLQDGRTIPAEHVRELRIVSASSPADLPDSMRVVLRGGSEVAVTGYTTSNAEATLQLAFDETLKVATRAVDRVLFSPPNESLDAKRQEVLKRELTADTVVILRPNKNLDYVEGVLGDVTEKSVSFQFDGDWIDVRRSKIDSFRYFRSAEFTPSRPRCQLTSRDGSTWEASQVSIGQDRIQLVLNSGLSVSLPLNSLQTIRFVSTSAVYLSDLKPERVDLTPSLQISALAEDLRELGSDEPFLPQSNTSLIGQQQPGLRLARPDGTLQHYQKGLAIHSRTELRYRLAGEYRQFQAVAGLAPAVRKAGSVIMQICADDQELFNTEIGGGASPANINLDVSGAKWLTILVDYGDASDIADRLNLCDARLIK